MHIILFQLPTYLENIVKRGRDIFEKAKAREFLVCKSLKKEPTAHTKTARIELFPKLRKILENL